MKEDALGRCVVCGLKFKTGDRVQAFLRNPDDKGGRWTQAVTITEGFQERIKRNRDEIKRTHVSCGIVITPFRKDNR